MKNWKASFWIFNLTSNDPNDIEPYSIGLIITQLANETTSKVEGANRKDEIFNLQVWFDCVRVLSFLNTEHHIAMHNGAASLPPTLQLHLESTKLLQASLVLASFCTLTGSSPIPIELSNESKLTKLTKNLKTSMMNITRAAAHQQHFYYISS